MCACVCACQRLVYTTQEGCEWQSEGVSKHNLNVKVRMGEGSFDGNPHWGCVHVCLCVCCVWQQQSHYCAIFSSDG